MPVVPLLFALAIMAAVAAVGARRLRRRRLDAAKRQQPGAQPGLAIVIRAFDEIDDHIGRRWCRCGGYLERAGEGSRQYEGRPLRFVRLVCQECDAVERVFFDVGDVLH